MKRIVVLAAIAGSAVAVGLVGWYGVDDVADAIRLAGWSGLGVVTLFQVLSVVLCGLAWWALPADGPSLGVVFFVWARWVRGGVSDVLALLPAGSELVGARMLAIRGVEGTSAGASVVVDMTAELVSQLLFTFAGVLLLVAAVPDSAVARWGAVGLAVAVPVVVGFLVAQRTGLFRLAGRITGKLILGGRSFGSQWGYDLHARIDAIYRQKWRFIGGVALHLGGWLSSAGGVWATLWLLDQPVAFHEALVIESVVYALRSAAFFVPFGAGVQEGGYVVVGALFGVPPGSALALALIKRGRDILLGVPAAANWLLVEQRRLKAV